MVNSFRPSDLPIFGMLLAPWGHHGDHAQTHREAAGDEGDGGEEGVGEGDLGQEIGDEDGWCAQGGGEAIHAEEIRIEDIGGNAICREEVHGAKANREEVHGAKAYREEESRPRRVQPQA
jgi:hypothetical protein